MYLQFSLLSFTIWEMLRTTNLCWYLKINFKLNRKRYIEEKNIENVSPSSFFLLSPEMDASFIFNDEYNCILQQYT